MPNLPTHIELAWQASLTIKDNLLDENLGQYLLGSTAPDIRVITKKPRSQYHFVDLDFDSVGDGQIGLFDTYPQLKDKGSVPPAQAALIAGYITHLVADETWITNMYRTYFADNKLFTSKIEAKLYDRVAQLTMDRKHKDSIQRIVKSISTDFNVFSIGSISRSEMLEWKNWVVDFLTSENAYNWSRLKNQANRISKNDILNPVHKIYDRFIENPDEGLKLLYKNVSKSNIRQYKTQASENIAEAISRYLS
tara:strand:- start:5242 stop:5994 length:753 start_codon:yes stop_codon:yes gene_type:complete